MIQAMQVLQLPLLELSERIEQELVENPFLEVVEPERDDGADAGADREPATDGADAMLDYLERIDRDFGDGGPPRAAGGEEGDRKYEAMLNAPEGARTFSWASSRVLALFYFGMFRYGKYQQPTV